MANSFFKCILYWTKRKVNRNNAKGFFACSKNLFWNAYDRAPCLVIEVSSVNVIKQEVKIVVEEGEDREIKTYNVSELKFKPKKKKFDLAAEELKQLEGLEGKDDPSMDSDQ